MSDRVYGPHHGADAERVAAYVALCLEYGVDAETTAPATSGEEDAADVAGGFEPCERWVAVTCATVPTGTVHYLPTHADRYEAAVAAVANVDDDIYAEWPVVLVDLDTGERWYPAPERVPFVHESGGAEFVVGAPATRGS